MAGWMLACWPAGLLTCLPRPASYLLTDAWPLQSIGMCQLACMKISLHEYMNLAADGLKYMATVIAIDRSDPSGQVSVFPPFSLGLPSPFPVCLSKRNQTHLRIIP
jgi:hypothetical protein